MRSKWTHSICEKCWEKLNPNRLPVRIIETATEICCFCSGSTTSGIFLRDDPANCIFNGVHEEVGDVK